MGTGSNSANIASLVSNRNKMIFFKNNYSVEPTDKELKRYLQEEVFA